jgi:hypothetical protein
MNNIKYNKAITIILSENYLVIIDSMLIQISQCKVLHLSK